MKFKIALIFLLFASILFAQKADDTKPFFTTSSQTVRIIPPLAGRELIPIDLTPKEHKNERWLNYPTNFKALPAGKDPLVSQNKTNQQRIAASPPIVNFDGATGGVHSGATPPDPTGAVGPNHYIHAYNSGFVIFDRLGNILVPHSSLSNIFPNETLGDPIVLYDRYADRFLITEFSNTPNAFLMAVSLGPDPVNDGWVTYRFNIDAFPDYPKFSIWHDGYYITANKDSGNVVYVADRDAMIAGNSSVNMVGFTLPGVTRNPNTIFAALAMNSIGPNLPSANTPGYITYLQDDAWASGPDQFKIWEVRMDWNNMASSTISTIPKQIFPSPFDTFVADFGQGEVPQPNTNSKIDGITGMISYMCNYYAFDDHNSITLNFNVDVNGDNRKLGIRWYELREDNGAWNIQQEGTFTTNGSLYRFMGSMAMDELGNIGMAYSKGNANNYTSLYFTGRYAHDAPGEMTINEELIVQSTGLQSFNRYGDYAQLTLDPTDNRTFWFTSEYFSGNNTWSTRVAAFKIASDAINDVGVIAIPSLADATLTNSETVTVTIFNFGENAQTNIPVSYSVDGVQIASEVYTGTINPASSATHTFAVNANLSTLGQTYIISATTNLTGDQEVNNNTYTKNVTHLNANDIGITQILYPNSGVGLTNSETISVVIRNFGGVSKTNFDVRYTIDNNAPVTETVTATVPAASSINYSFTTQGDFSTLGEYNLTATTLLNNDIDNTNNRKTITVQNTTCIPRALNDCNIDGIKRFVLGTIDIDDGASGCNTEGGSGALGYADRTNLSTDIDKNSNPQTVKIQQNWTSGINGDEKFAMWIDFNDDGVFEMSEQVILGTMFLTSNDLEDFSFIIPMTATLGTHILRARAVDTSASPGEINDSCADYQYGETQDYIVNIIDSNLGINDVSFDDVDMRVIQIGNNQFKIELPTTKITETMVVTLHNVLGQKFVKNRVENTNGLYTYTMNLNGLSPGVYLVRLGNSDFGKVKRIIVN